MPEVCKHYKTCKTCKESRKIKNEKILESMVISEVNFYLSKVQKPIDYKYTILHTLIVSIDNLGIRHFDNGTKEVSIKEIINELERLSGEF